jgi:hypothetical protein
MWVAVTITDAVRCVPDTAEQVHYGLSGANGI